MEAAAKATSPDDLFLRLEERGVLLRIDRSVFPTMAKTPTLAQWELDLLRTLENVVRLGHVRQVEPTRMALDEGEVTMARDTVVVHCAAPGLRYPPLVPIWGVGTITLQPIRVGFPCFGAALAGYVEATFDDDAEKNRLCPPSPYCNTTDRLGTDAGAGWSVGGLVRVQPRHQGMGRRGPAEPARGPPRASPTTRP